MWRSTPFFHSLPLWFTSLLWFTSSLVHFLTLVYFLSGLLPLWFTSSLVHFLSSSLPFFGLLPLFNSLGRPFPVTVCERHCGLRKSKLTHVLKWRRVSLLGSEMNFGSLRVDQITKCVYVPSDSLVLQFIDRVVWSPSLATRTFPINVQTLAWISI